MFFNKKKEEEATTYKVQFSFGGKLVVRAELNEPITKERMQELIGSDQTVCFSPREGEDLCINTADLVAIACNPTY
jgi:hypothetical protein